MKRKLFSLLVLLLTAVTGAWADATIAKLWVGNSEEVTSEGTITGTGATEGTASASSLLVAAITTVAFIIKVMQTETPLLSSR